MEIIKSFINPEKNELDQNRFAAIRFAIIAGVLISSAILAPYIALGKNHANYLLYGLFGTCSALLAIYIFSRWPVVLLILVMVGGIFIKFAGPGGLNISLIGIAALLGLWILEMINNKHRSTIFRSRTMRPLISLLIISFLSFGIGQIPWFEFAENAPLSAQFGGLSIVVFSLVAFLLTANLVRDLRWLQALTWTFIAFGTFYILGRIVNWGRIDLIYLSGFTAGSMFWTWFVALTFGQAFFNHGLRLRYRLLLYLVVLITLYIAVVKGYDWKSGWVPAIVAIAAMLGCRYLRAALISIPLWSFPAYLIANKAIGSDDYSWGTRLDAWVIVTQIAKANPLTGVGFANYYWYTPLFHIRGYSVRFNSHSQYVDLIAEMGLLGLAAFFWCFWEVGRLAWNLRNRVTDGFARGYIYGALGGLVGTLAAAALVDWVFPFVYNIGMSGFRASVIAWIFMGGVVSIEQIVSRRSFSAPDREG